VLVVEDEAPVRNLVVELLKSSGYHVLDAESGEAAIELASQEEAAIDLLLTDMIMRKIGGMRLAERLKGERPDLKVLFMSGYTDDTVLHQGLPGPFMSFIQKPFSPSGLLARVRELLDARKPPDRVRG
jgi:two-component system cell cycle sensor histidine kinase/response regulator CckA